ncbi:hypothetical protein KY334_03545 [Candidatus Woesearchaeota archaeon]|nr:hypothetical protein [Candidatus Woesearchaeota archaeon]
MLKELIEKLFKEPKRNKTSEEILRKRLELCKDESDRRKFLLKLIRNINKLSPSLKRALELECSKETYTNLEYLLETDKPMYIQNIIGYCSPRKQEGFVHYYEDTSTQEEAFKHMRKFHEKYGDEEFIDLGLKVKSMYDGDKRYTPPWVYQDNGLRDKVDSQIIEYGGFDLFDDEFKEYSKENKQKVERSIDCLRKSGLKLIRLIGGKDPHKKKRERIKDFLIENGRAAEYVDLAFKDILDQYMSCRGDSLSDQNYIFGRFMDGFRDLKKICEDNDMEDQIDFMLYATTIVKYCGKSRELNDYRDNLICEGQIEKLSEIYKRREKLSLGYPHQLYFQSFNTHKLEDNFFKAYEEGSKGISDMTKFIYNSGIYMNDSTKFRKEYFPIFEKYLSKEELKEACYNTNQIGLLKNMD